MRARGTIKWFNNRHGWGFIARAGEPDIFVRHDRVCGTGYKELREGDVVEFEIREGAHGPYAAQVLRLTPAGAVSRESGGETS